MVSGGFGCSTANTTVDAVNVTTTFLDTENVIDSDGFINSYCIYNVENTGSDPIKLKIFRLVGSYYEVVWSGDLVNIDSSSSIKTFGLNQSVPVKAGDLVGITAFPGPTDSFKILATGGGGDTIYYLNDDVVTSTLTTDWTASFKDLRMHVSSDILTHQYVSTSGDNYLPGTDWLNAKNDIKDGLRFIPTSGTVHIGFGSYVSDSGIKFDKSVSLLAETESTGGGTGIVNLPSATWSSFDYSNFSLDRQNLNTNDATGDLFDDNAGGKAFLHMGEIPIHASYAQRFVPATSGLKKVTLRLQRILDNDLYVEIREDLNGSPNGNAQESTGRLAFVVVPYSSISTLTYVNIDITFEDDIGTREPVWLITSLNAYDPNSINNDVSYNIGFSQYGTIDEVMKFTIGVSSWLSITPTGFNLYFKTYRGI